MGELAKFDTVAAGGLDVQERGTAQLANAFNSATIRHTRRWILHHPVDADLAGADLRRPRTTEITVPDGDFARMGELLCRASRNGG
ncbi:hypothetical protein [Amycolatopsis lurida]|uniref:Uncharacterized protein n=1 Tax=Amycolatopsis lurida NRRL 2430 TaxID=1460371 RepID=A0A2P2FU66_AMYLU|nr:hypothetical protein [Amycolatopsis lurida]KFU80264.1 hypothetical protein BB31_15665 [Amycolatopsis lurida NRRL 2430]